MSKKRRHGRHNPIYREGMRPVDHRNPPAAGSRKGNRSWLVTLALLMIAGLLVYAYQGSRKASSTAAANSSSNTNQPGAAPAQTMPPVTPTPAPKAPPAGPRIQFATRHYNFGKVEGDQSVNCTFVFTNTGTELLELTQVNPSCGCLKIGDWTRQVTPGNTGTIAVNYNSRFYTGPFGKSVHVVCNDALEPNVNLEVSGTVFRPIEVTPFNATINVNAEAPSNAATVKIISHTDAPLILSNLECTLKTLAVELQTNQPGKEYQLLVKTLPPWPTNNMPGVIRLKTSATNTPELEIKSWINYEPLVMAIPSQVRLAPLPLTNAYPATFWVRNNGTNRLALAEPSVNAKGVDVQIKEDLAGKQFTVKVNFPAGFDAPPNYPLEVSLKSNHPQYPVIKVPIFR